MADNLKQLYFFSFNIVNTKQWWTAQLLFFFLLFFSREHILTHIVHQLKTNKKKKSTAIAWIQTKPKQLCARWPQRCFALPQEPLDQVFHPPHPTTMSTSLLYSIDRVEPAARQMKRQKACCLVVADSLLIITVHTSFWDDHFSTQNGEDTSNPSLLDRKKKSPIAHFLVSPSFKCICLIKRNVIAGNEMTGCHSWVYLCSGISPFHGLSETQSGHPDFRPVHSRKWNEAN